MSDSQLAASVLALLDGTADTFLVCAGAGAVVSQKTASQAKTLLALVKADVGLGSVDNTADTAKPVSTAQATADGLRVLKAGDTMTGALVVSANAAASTPPICATGTWFTGGTGTTTKPQLLLEPSGTNSVNWNTAGSGIGVNAASGFTGALVEAQVAGAWIFKLEPQKLNFRSGAGAVTQLDIQPSIGTVLRWATTVLLLDSVGVAITGDVASSATFRCGIYTVATLPSAAANAYREANVSDALAPTMGATVADGGSVKTKVRSNGTNWTVCGI